MPGNTAIFGKRAPAFIAQSPHPDAPAPDIASASVAADATTIAVGSPPTLRANAEQEVLRLSTVCLSCDQRRVSQIGVRPWSFLTVFLPTRPDTTTRLRTPRVDGVSTGPRRSG